MAVEKTLSILKPDSVAKNVTGKIIARFEEAGLRVLALRMQKMTETETRGFYAEHEGKPFFESLIQYMTSGPVVLQVLEGENAVAKNCEFMGTTDLKEAAPGTIRADFADSIDTNAIHGSDSTDSAKREIDYFFTADQLCPR